MSKTSSYSGKAGISVKVNFDSLLEKIAEAQGDAEAATWEAARAGARALYNELQAECAASGVPASVSGAITMQAERDSSGNRFACKVGWRVPEYNPANLSPAYKAIFINYGTPHRYTKAETARVNINGEFRTIGSDRGRIDGRGFIGRAKKKARPKIKAAQKEALVNILGELPKK